MLKLDYRDARPIYEQIKDGLCQMMLAGVLGAGDKLPSVRELATALTINPNTIQRAYKELEAEGYIYSVPGKGSFSGDLEEIKRKKIRELTVEFDKVTARLIELGVAKNELILRIEEDAR